MKRIAGQSEEAPGQDSFLDIVANIVGILIILVVVAGMRSKDAWIKVVESKKRASATGSTVLGVESTKQAADAAEAEVQKAVGKVQRAQVELALRFQERNRLQELLTALQRAHDQKRLELDDDARREYDRRVALARARRRLYQLDGELNAVQQTDHRPTVLRHVPTPLARTVFGKEEHFQLQHGRLTYVPMNEMIEKLRAQWEQKLWKLKNAPQATETIGPVRGFRMKYTIRPALRVEMSDVGPIRRQVIEVAGFILLPVSSDLGEPFTEALAPGSEFRRMVAGWHPDQTTITVWTYPDSFDKFRILKEELYKLGFATAARPMPEGQPIGGSPHGSKSAAE